MDKENLADIIEAAMDNVHDMDVTFRQYAEAAADAILAKLDPDAKDARIAELEAERDACMDQIEEALDQRDDAAARAEAAEAKLAVAIAGLKECENEIDDCVRHEYPHDHPVQERYRQRGFSSNPARATLAQLKGTADG